jgi:uncharacterized tellurite resistance protein B-like protein
MFDAIKEFFKKMGGAKEPSHLKVDRSGEGIDEALLTAVVAVLIEMSSVDQHVDKGESDQMMSLLDKHFDLPHELTIKYVERAIAERGNSKNIDEFINRINESYNDVQKELLLALVWRIVLADEKVEDKERKLVVQMRYRFKLSEEAATRAQDKARLKQV